MTAPSAMMRLLAALLLCALASVAVVHGGAPAFRALAVGSFMLAAPGLVLTTMLRVRDPLLSAVVAMVVGPAAWTLLATVATFLGWWWPAPTVVAVALLIGFTCLVLLVQQLRAPANPLDDAQHRFAAHLHDEVVLTPVGRHRGAFPLH